MKLVQFISNIAIVTASTRSLQTALEKICEVRSIEIAENNEFTEDEKITAFTLLDEQCGGLRDLTNPHFQVADLDNYGCWCRFASTNHGKGSGVPVDFFDGLCKHYHEAVTCLAMDYGTDCNPWEVTYQMVVYPWSKTVDCESLNTDECAINLCKVETHFVIGVLDETTGLYGTRPDYQTYSSAHRDFDSSVWNYECKTGNKMGGGQQLSCCGEYHLRYPFKTSTTGSAGVSKECCDKDNGDFGTKTYNPTTSECCDGSVQPIGSNC